MYVLICVGFNALLCFAELQMYINFFLSRSQPGYLVCVFSLIVLVELVSKIICILLKYSLLLTNQFCYL